MKFSTPMIVLSAALTALGVGALGILTGGGWTHEGALMATRLTARFSFPIFLLAWSASALAALFPGGWRTALLRRRRAVGLSFAAAHGVHLAFILNVVLVFHHAPPMVTVYGGGFVYVLIAAMALTSNDAAIAAMGRRAWKALHATGGVAVLLIFANSYAARVKTMPWLGAPALLLIALAVTLKLAAWTRRNRTFQAA